MIAQNDMPLRVGGLLYTPALNAGILSKIEENVYPCLTSIAFCLEDSIQDEALAEAEHKLAETLDALRKSTKKLPMLFVRVRTPKHLARIHALLSDKENILTGYVLPKFDMTNCDAYAELIRQYNENRTKPLYIMPILESKAVADVCNRAETLLHIKAKLDLIRAYVLNIRVGGNDFSNMYGLRRKVSQDIYQIGVIRDILVNIIDVFATDYVVSGPVWEYFGDNPTGDWAVGLRNEIKMDILNGFVGKTAIHPTQLPIIYDELRVNRADYEDAKHIVQWRSDGLAVEKSENGNRMNEAKCHLKWAERVLMLGQIYGVKDQQTELRKA